MRVQLLNQPRYNEIFLNCFISQTSFEVVKRQELHQKETITIEPDRRHTKYGACFCVCRYEFELDQRSVFFRQRNLKCTFGWMGHVKPWHIQRASLHHFSLLPFEIVFIISYHLLLVLTTNIKIIQFLTLS